MLLIKQSQEQAFGNLLKIGEKVCTDKDFIYRIEIEKNAVASVRRFVIYQSTSPI